MLSNHSPPLLCQIYRRDVLSLILREDVEQWRLASRLSNSVIEDTPEKRLPRRRLDEFYIDAVRGVYSPEEIQLDGIVSADATRKRSVGQHCSLSMPTDCLRWEFDPTRLGEAVNRLVGQPILVGGTVERGADEVISFLLEHTLEKHQRGRRLEMRNQLTEASATQLLHLLHHLGTGTYTDVLALDLYNYDQEAPTRVYERDTSGARLNTAIFDALRHSRGGRRGLELYGFANPSHELRVSVFSGGQAAGSVRLHLEY